MNGKPWYRSKTVWLNLLALLIGVLTIVAGSELIPPQVTAVITALVIPILNLFLRFVTNQPLQRLIRGGR